MAATDQTNIPSVTTETAIEVILAAYEAGKHPVMLWGPPGIGKTALVYQAAKQIGGEVVDFRLVTTEPTDLRGYPVVLRDAEGNPTGMAWAPAALLPKDPDWKGFVFLDELPQAPTMNMNASAELVYDRRLGNDYTLPPGAMVLAAGNRRNDRAGTIEVPTHMKNRLIHLDVKADPDVWCRWARRENLHEGLIAFIEANPRQFHVFDKDTLAFPTPRSWHFVSDFLNRNDKPEVRRALIGGAVGKGSAIELEAFLDKGKGVPSYEEIIADPKNAPTGSSENQAYALISMVASHAKEADLEAVCIYLGRHRRDNVRPLVHRMVSKNKEFLTNPHFSKLAKSIGEDRKA
jgi:hypothetical protein